MLAGITLRRSSRVVNKRSARFHLSCSRAVLHVRSQSCAWMYISTRRQRACEPMLLYTRIQCTIRRLTGRGAFPACYNLRRAVSPYFHRSRAEKSATRRPLSQRLLLPRNHPSSATAVQYRGASRAGGDLTYNRIPTRTSAAIASLCSCGEEVLC